MTILTLSDQTPERWLRGCGAVRVTVFHAPPGTRLVDTRSGAAEAVGRSQVVVSRAALASAGLTGAVLGVEAPDPVAGFPPGCALTLQLEGLGGGSGDQILVEHLDVAGTVRRDLVELAFTAEGAAVRRADRAADGLRPASVPEGRALLAQHAAVNLLSGGGLRPPDQGFALLVDITGSMAARIADGTVQRLVETVLGVASAVPTGPRGLVLPVRAGDRRLPPVTSETVQGWVATHLAPLPASASCPAPSASGPRQVVLTDTAALPAGGEVKVVCLVDRLAVVLLGRDDQDFRALPPPDFDRILDEGAEMRTFVQWLLTPSAPVSAWEGSVR